MKIITSIKEMRSLLDRRRKKGDSIGLIPTMGYLHQGHLTLMRESVKENEVNIVSIFVNPTQFGPDEDYEQYPRDLQSDSEKVKSIGIDYIFAPEVKEMYPEGYQTYVEVKDITKRLCGKTRPGHFQGVTTIVSKLFNIVQPDRAYFGQKDFQQFMVIKRMIKDLNFSVELRMIPIVREEDGLAMSSRNKYLNKKERKAAGILYKALCKAKDLINQGVKNPLQIKKILEDIIGGEDLARIDYVAVVDPETFITPAKIEDEVLLAVAVYIGKTRLIDNIYIREGDK